MDINREECEHGVSLDEWCALCAREEEQSILFGVLLAAAGLIVLALVLALTP